MIETRRMTVQVGTFLLRDVSVSIASGTYCVLMGKTGSGKTTLLEAVCGLKRIVSGQVVLDGRDVTNLKPAERGIGFVPQDGALFPTMTVRRHLEFAVDIRNWPRRQFAHRVDQLAATLGLEDLLEPSDRRPKDFYRGYDVYDRDQVGFVTSPDNENARRFGFSFDVRLPGNSNDS